MKSKLSKNEEQKENLWKKELQALVRIVDELIQSGKTLMSYL